MKTTISFLVIILSFEFNVAQVTPLWTKTFGGSNIDVGHYVQQTSDGGYIITGYTRSYGSMSGRNALLIKTDANGNTLWINGYGGSNDEEAYAVQQTADGGYVVTGYTKSFGAGAMDVYLLKIDSAGNQLWYKTFGGSNDEEGYSIILTADGGYLIAGATSSSGAGGRDVYLIKTDGNGNTAWTKTLGGMSSDGARNIIRTSDGNYVLTGWTFSQGAGFLGNCLLMKVDMNGNLIWSKAFGGDDVDRGHAVKQTSDGGFIVTGYTDSFGAGLYDLFLVRTDSSGNEIWNKTVGGTGRDYGHSLAITSDGGFIITGYTLSFGAGGDDLWLVKTNAEGVEEWKSTFGGTASDVGFWLDLTTEGDVVIVGHTLSSGAGLHDVWFIKISNFIPVELISFNAKTIGNSVELNWSTSSEKNNLGFEILRSVQHKGFEKIGFIKGVGTTTEQQSYSFIDDLNSILTLTHNLNLSLQYKLKQIDFDGTENFLKEIVVEINDATKPKEFVLHQNYPNPCNPSTKIKFTIPALTPSLSHGERVILKVYDILGREVATLVNAEFSPGEYEVEFNIHNELSTMNYELISNIYFYRLTAGSFSATKKFILLK